MFTCHVALLADQFPPIVLCQGVLVILVLLVIQKLIAPDNFNKLLRIVNGHDMLSHISILLTPYLLFPAVMPLLSACHKHFTTVDKSVMSIQVTVIL